jgi:hypothetical protein
MNEHLRNTASTFEDYAKAADAYAQQEEVFRAAVKRWKEAVEAESGLDHE